MNVYGPSSRVLTLLEILQSRGMVPAAELAARLEVERRTVRRYVTALRDLGIPVKSTPGRHGGYSLGAGSKLPPLMFDDGEALAVVVSLLRSSPDTASSPIDADVASALGKIHRVLPDAIRRQVRALSETLEFTDAGASLPGWSRVPTDESTVLAVALAVQLQQRLTIRYRAWQGTETTRQLDTYGIVHHLGAWYAVGWCHLREDLRVFRLDRIQKLETETGTFERPSDFDAPRFVADALATAPYRWHIEVVLDTVLEEVQPLIPAGLAALRSTNDGVVLESGYEHLEQFARFLVSLGVRFRIVRPDELHDVVRRVGQELLDIAGTR